MLPFLVADPALTRQLDQHHHADHQGWYCLGCLHENPGQIYHLPHALHAQNRHKSQTPCINQRTLAAHAHTHAHARAHRAACMQSRCSTVSNHYRKATFAAYFKTEYELRLVQPAHSYKTSFNYLQMESFPAAGMYLL